MTISQSTSSQKQTQAVNSSCVSLGHRTWQSGIMINNHCMAQFQGQNPMTRVVLVNHTPQATLPLILVFGFLQCQIRMYFLFDWHVAISNPTVIFMSPRRMYT